MTNEQKYWIVTVALILLMWGVSFIENTHKPATVVAPAVEHEPLS